MKNEMDGACSMYGGEERCIQGFGGKTYGKEPLARPRSRWEGNIKIELQEVEAWTDLRQDTGRWRELVNAVINLRAP